MSVEVGKKYGKLTIIRALYQDPFPSYFLCRCDCTEESYIKELSLFSGSIIQCYKCHNKEWHEKHGNGKDE